jgi:hypothetical protein
MKFSSKISLLGAAALRGSSLASAFVAPVSNQAIAARPLSSSVLRVKARGEGYGPPLENISEAVGNTPLVKISDRICPEGRTIYAKCEFFNPLSSVKDRLALSIIETAEKDGSLKPGQTVVEATSGNTGIGTFQVETLLYFLDCSMCCMKSYLFYIYENRN